MAEVRHEFHYGTRMVRCFKSRDDDLFSRFVAALPVDGSKPAIVQQHGQISYDDLREMIAGFAQHFARQGLVKGDRVVLYSDNRADYIAAIYAAFATGIVAIPVDVRLTPDEMGYIVRDSAAKLVLVAPDHVDTLRRGPFGDLVQSLAAVPTAPVGQMQRSAIAEEDAALIVYTSGTTGKPKGAVLTHLGIIHSCLHFWDNIGLTPDDVVGVVTPITHVTGLIMGVIVALQNGASMALLQRFRARDFLAFVAQTRMTWTVMVPAMYSLCLLETDFDSHDLSSWRIGNYGGSPMPEPVIAALAQKMPWLLLANGYGATETSSPAVMTRPGEGPARGYSIGRPLRCVDILVVDPEGHEVAPGEAGELWIKGPMLAREYFANPEATAANFAGGYWRSGDIVRVDADGYVILLDRIKDVINRAGYKVYSAEVENLLQALPGVVEVAVVPRPCAVLGERVHVVIYATDATLDLPSLRAFCAGKLADYKIPETADIRLMPLPKGPSGKILKKALKIVLSEEKA